MVQVDYEFYSETYGGTDVPREVFDRFAYRAGVLLDSMIRVGKTDLDTDKMQRLLCEICDRLYHEDRRQGIVRESLDGYDVSYDTTVAESCEVLQLVRQYLGGDGVLFRGRRL